MQHLFTRSLLIYFFFVLGVITLYVARPLLEPLAVAGMLAVLFTPLSAWMEGKKINRIIAAIICVLLLLIISFGIVALFYSQLSSIGGNISGIKDNLSEVVSNIQQFIQDNFSIPISKQNNMLDKQTTGSVEINKIMTSIVGPFITIIINVVLVIVYMTLLLCYRTHFLDTIVKIIPQPDRKRKAHEMIAQSAKVVQHYFSGLAIIIASLWVMYGFGFSIVGLKGALFFALLCGSLEVIPFVGNITGCSLAALMALSQGGGISMALGILGVYAIIQSIQFYIISPFVFGAEININPLFIIFILIAGELLWGVPGMIIAIPVLGIVKIILGNIESLKHYSELIGNGNTRKSSLVKRILKHKGK